MAQFSMIAENLNSMEQLAHLRDHAKKLKFLNLHGNNLRQISCIEYCYYLEELDLSSNKITTVSGLEGCESLVKLNLSCNQIRLPSGLDFLYKLQTLNLSYNKLANVKSLSHFSEKRFTLENLLLHGNKLNSVPATVGTLKRILTLKSLTLHSNPLCSNPKYRRVFGDCMPQLETIDDFPRADESFSDSVTTCSSSVSTEPIATPYIDNAIKRYRHELNTSSDSAASVERVACTKPQTDAAPDRDYTTLIKQVLTIIREEDKPVKLDKNHEEEHTAEPLPEDGPVDQRHDITPDLSTVMRDTASPDVASRDTASPDVASRDIASLRSTNTLLLVELETEREKRWKSEQHISELSDKLLKNDNHIKEYEVLNKSSEAGIKGIRELLLKEQNQKLKLAGLLEAFKNKHKDVVGVLREKDSAIAQREEEVEKLHKTVEGLKRASSDTVKQHRLALQQARQEAQVQRKQGELLRQESNGHQAQVKSLQELVVTREQEHVREKENLVPLNGQLFNKRVQELVGNEQEKHELMNKNLVDSARDWQQKHLDLEREFRIALYLENTRYQDLHSSYTKISEQLSRHKSEVSRLKSEDAKKLGLIDKLKRSVGEQSAAIDRVCRVKKESEEKSKIRVAALEAELEETTKRVLELTSFQKDNTALRGEVAAQHSVIEGLRGERNLWSKELAEQGAQLSLDRGKMQCDMERLTKERGELSKEVETLRDAARIKQHQLNDAMDSISKLKDSITFGDRDHDDQVLRLQDSIKQLSEESGRSEERIEALRAALAASQEDKEELNEKHELQLDESDKIRKKYKDLKMQWENKVAVFEKVEKAAQEMSSVHAEQCRHLESRVAVEQEKTRRVEEASQKRGEEHGRQIQCKELELRKEVDAVSQEFQEREAGYKDQVLKLEQEMRLIIHQSQQLKQDNDAKLSKLAGALGEFTQLLHPK